MDLSMEGNILIFGPQDLAFDVESFKNLRLAILATPWVQETFRQLPKDYEVLSKTYEKLKVLPGAKLLEDLNTWIETGNFPQAALPLPNVLLTPLVVATHLTQCSEYLGLHGFSRTTSDDPRNKSIKDQVPLGFCTGILSALAVSSSGNEEEFRKYGAVALRLATMIGATVDAYDILNGESTSLSVAWKASDIGGEIAKIIESFPKTYISVQYDENRATITTYSSMVPALLQQLRATGATAIEVGLRGRFHSNCHEEDFKFLIHHFDQDPQFQFPSTPSPVGIWQADNIRKENPHHFALRSILLEKCNWYKTLASVVSMLSTENQSPIVSFGSESTVPPTLMRKIGHRLVSAGDKKTVLDDERILSDEDIAVVGMACKTAGADDLEEFWDVLCRGESQHIEVQADRFGFSTPWREIDHNRKWYGNFINDHDAFDHKFFKKTPREIASTDPQQRWMLQIAYQAVEQSGYFQSFQNDKSAEKHIGCYIGLGCIDYEQNIACHPANAFSATGNLRSFVAGKISHYFGWTGPSLTVDTACSSSAVAIHQACRAILSGECTAALAGGVTIMTSPLWFQNLAGASFLSPTGNCKPFDAKADGYCRGEAVGAVYLKKLSQAISDGDQILGVIASTAVYQNQNFTPIFVPNALSLSQLFGNVTQKAGLEPKQISVVEAHGTGTPVGDPAEYESILRVLGGASRKTGKLSLGSVKGLVGHTETAAGIVSLIKTLLMLQKKAIPPQASFSTINPGIHSLPSDNIDIPTTLLPWKDNFKAALINNYGASGSNASLIVIQPPSQRKRVLLDSLARVSKAKYPFWLCGLDDRSLRNQAKRLRHFLQTKKPATEDLSLENLSFNLFRQSNRTLPRALTFSCNSVAELENNLIAFENAESSIPPISPPSARPVVLCFGGQVSKFVGLDRQLYDNISILRTHLDQCNTLCCSLGIQSIYPAIFQRQPIEDIVTLQVALFAMQYSCARSWMDCGITPVALIGHSLGELTALCVSGTLSLRDALTMIASRATIIRNSWGDEKGSMAAVEAPTVEDLEKLLLESSHDCEEEPAATIACYNTPNSFTLAGSTRSIEAVLNKITTSSKFSTMRAKKLNVTNAFHSTLVENIIGELELVTQGLEFREPAIHVERAVEFDTSTDFKTGLGLNFVAEHLRRPVYFSHAAHRLSDKYPSCVWLEAGSNSTIAAMAGKALALPKTSHFQSINITCDNGFQSLADATVALWKQGLPTVFWPHHSSQAATYTPLLLPPYQFEKSRHWTNLKTIKEQGLDPADLQTAPLDTLWSFVGYQDTHRRQARFSVNTKSQKFANYVSGHTIAQTAPLCPSTLQVDIVIEALFSILPNLSKAKFQPQLRSLENHAPIGLNTSETIWLDAEAIDTSSLSWNFTMLSHSALKNPASKLHVSGQILFVSVDDEHLKSDFARYEHLSGHNRCQKLLNDSNANHIIQGKNIYKTFSEIVDYGDIYRGVQKIVGNENESAGRVVKAYSGDTWLDTCLADSFCQVAGIFVNCMTENQPDKDICISNKIEKWIRSPRITSDGARPEVWDVLALHRRVSKKEFLSDVFVFDPKNGLLMEAILGIGYIRVPKASLVKVLCELTPGAKAVDGASISASISLQNSSSVKKQSEAASDTPKVVAVKKPSSSSIVKRIKALLANVSGLEPDEIKSDTGLADIGIDSLMGMELAREIETDFKCSLDASILGELTDFKSLQNCILAALSTEGEQVSSRDDEEEPHVSIPSTPTTENSDLHSGPNDIESDSNSSVATVDSPTNGTHDLPKGELQIPSTTLSESFAEIKALTDSFVQKHKLSGYATMILPKQNMLCVAYIVEALETLGCPIAEAEPGKQLQKVKHLPKHEKYINYLYMILEKEGRLITIDGDVIVRTGVATPDTSSTLLQNLVKTCPDHTNDLKLIDLIGSKLADCLSGKSDGIQLIFGSAEGRELVSGLYGKSPINMVWLKLMEEFISRLVSRLPKTNGPIKIFEMGAGTGGTTAIIAPLLAKLDVAVEYTFSDLSPSLIAAARKRFKQYSFMKFRVHDIEQPPPTELLKSQHIVVAFNCIHATQSLPNSTKNIHSILQPDGFLMLLEMTNIMYWVDLVFGVLEGWWLYNDGRQHVVVPETFWRDTMKSVGYGYVDWTKGDLPECDLQRIIVGRASPRYENLPDYPKQVKSPTADHIARQSAVDEYVQRYTKDFRIPIQSGQSGSMKLRKDFVVIVTGASGSLGSHIVAKLAQMPNVRTVVCLNRRSSIEPFQRQMRAFESRGISVDPDPVSKLKIYETNTAKPMLGLPAAEYQSLVESVTHIIHNAWPMSIKRPIREFEVQFQVMKNLLDLSREISCNAAWKIGFQFISSIATVGLHPICTGISRVPEEPMTAQSVLTSGYGDAKLVCERMLDKTIHQYPDRFSGMVVRIGQIAGSRASGYWNPVEHFSFLVKSSQALKAFPDFPGELSWLPVDDVASTLIELLIPPRPISDLHPIFHIENPVRQSWHEMTAILSSELNVPLIPFEQWLQRVRGFDATTSTENPAAMLVDFLDEHFIRMSCGGLILDTTKSRERSISLANARPVDEELARQYVASWKRSGFLKE